MNFCSNCGTPIVEHYLLIFERIEKDEKAGATGLGRIAPVWMLYRKVYCEFVIVWGLSFIALITRIGLIFRIGMIIYLICNGHQIYYQSILRKLDKNGLTGVDIDKHPEKR